MMRELAYAVVDVFAERVLEGNPLAVFQDGRGLSAAQMQALARETNLSETTFVLPEEDAERERTEGVRVRIFTTQEELPFAGHPTLGTASWLRENRPSLRGAAEVKLRLQMGVIPVTFAPAEANDERSVAQAGVFATMRQNDPEFGAEFDREEVARVIGMQEADLLEGYAPQSVSTGNAFCMVALRSVEALGRLAIPQREATAWLKQRGVRWFYCIAPADSALQTSDCLNGWQARMQFYGGEDPATGSAAGPCIAWMVKRGLAASEGPTVIMQGVEMRRPSRITVQARVEGERVTDVKVSGRTIPVAEGRFFLPE